ncbi:unnamed protein product (macronuclear) [Paramecium tetraurelia]|uniref:Cyclic nucleotide-binding domain-containing protein n=1 Tax=Paramecium tetraurelia TaxID=5888 RepID=A0EAL3_PARTE|nr:uncharacterized protein GSPATT00025064001 [Paramecium tetraurelia]CAK92330.1 unnamed protein product [Paramecium tetraurelia]|eukprot:XP_001459727.1 hypothetical protein (macronuclear) [Paramecium tetraurelia strain d4-2]
MNASENLINIYSPDNSRATLVEKRRKLDADWKSAFMLQTIRNKAEKREDEIIDTSKIGQQWQVKQFHTLTEKQLNVIDDFGSGHSKGTASKQVKKQETQFESIYYESKSQMGKLRGLVLRFLEKHNKNQEWSIKPSHPFIIVWNMFKLFFMIHIFILFPLIDAFGVKLESMIVQQQQIFLMEWLFLLFDIVLRFNVQIYKNGQLIKQHQYLALQYLKSGFFLDALGIVGFSLFLFQDILYIKYIYFFKISEIKKFIKFLRYELDPQNKYNNHIKLITLFVTIFLLAHIIACLWIVAGDKEPSWISNNNLKEDQWYIQYLWAFYFAILTMTTVGYGDIVPVNENELMACIMIVLLSSAIFAYTLNTITTVLKDIDQNKSQFNQEARIIQNYLVKKGCDTDLQRRVQQYLKSLWKWGLGEQKQNEERVFSKLSLPLQQEINLQDKGQMLLKLPFLVNNFNIECIKELMQHIQEVYFQPGEFINPQDGVYLLYKGQAEVCWGSKTNPKCICNIFQGDHYGLLNLFNADQPKYFLKTSDFSIFYFIPTQIFKQVLKNNDKEIFCMIHDQVIYENYSNLYLFCPLCRREGHLICQDIIYKPNRAIAIAKSNRQTVQDRQKHKRFFVKQQILRNYKEMQIETCQFINDRRDLMKIKYKTIFDSDDAEEEPESLELQSSQSWQFDESQMDEQKITNNNDENQFKPKVTLQKRQTPNKRQTILGFLRKKTQDAMQINLQKIEEVDTPHNNNCTPNSRDKLYNLDVMKTFTKYFKQYNYENIIKQLNRRRKTIKTKIKRLERFS